MIHHSDPWLACPVSPHIDHIGRVPNIHTQTHKTISKPNTVVHLMGEISITLNFSLWWIVNVRFMKCNFTLIHVTWIDLPLWLLVNKTWHLSLWRQWPYTEAVDCRLEPQRSSNSEISLLNATVFDLQILAGNDLGAVLVKFWLPGHRKRLSLLLRSLLFQIGSCNLWSAVVCNDWNETFENYRLSQMS